MTSEIEGVDIILDLGKATVPAYYDLQNLRISSSHRVRDIVRRKIMGIPMSTPERKKETKTFDEKFKDKNIVGYLDDMFKKGQITDNERRYLFDMINVVNGLKKQENSYKKLMEQYLMKEEIWHAWLKNVRGIGEVIAANLVNKFGYCEVIVWDKKENVMYARETGDEKKLAKGLQLVMEDGKRYKQTGFFSVNHLNSYCGMDVTKDGVATRAMKGVKSHFDRDAKQICFKISESFKKQRSQPYRDIYDVAKAGYLDRVYEPGVLYEKYGKGYKSETTKQYKREDTKLILGHAGRMALRKTAKIFLQHYWTVSRQLKGLSTEPPFIIKNDMKHTHYISPPNIPESLQPFDCYKEGHGSTLRGKEYTKKV